MELPAIKKLNESQEKFSRTKGTVEFAVKESDLPSKGFADDKNLKSKPKKAPRRSTLGPSERDSRTTEIATGKHDVIDEKPSRPAATSVKKKLDKIKKLEKDRPSSDSIKDDYDETDELLSPEVLSTVVTQTSVVIDLKSLEQRSNRPNSATVLSNLPMTVKEAIERIKNSFSGRTEERLTDFGLASHSEFKFQQSQNWNTFKTRALRENGPEYHIDTNFAKVMALDMDNDFTLLDMIQNMSDNMNGSNVNDETDETQNLLQKSNISNDHVPLFISIGSVSVSQHGLLIDEERLEIELKHTHGRYMQLIQSSELTVNVFKLNSIFQHRSSSSSPPSSSSDSIPNMIDILSRSFSYILEVDECIKDILSKWDEIQRLRRHQKFSATCIQIEVCKILAMDKRMVDHATSMNDLKRVMTRDVSEAFLSDCFRDLVTGIALTDKNSSKLTGSFDDIAQKLALIDMNEFPVDAATSLMMIKRWPKITSSISSWRQLCASDLVLFCSCCINCSFKDDKFRLDGIPEHEVRRRELMSSYKMYLDVKMNQSIITTTAQRRLCYMQDEHGWGANFDQIISVLVDESSCKGFATRKPVLIERQANISFFGSSLPNNSLRGQVQISINIIPDFDLVPIKLSSIAIPLSCHESIDESDVLSWSTNYNANKRNKSVSYQFSSFDPIEIDGGGIMKTDEKKTSDQSASSTCSPFLDACLRSLCNTRLVGRGSAVCERISGYIAVELSLVTRRKPTDTSPRSLTGEERDNDFGDDENDDHDDIPQFALERDFRRLLPNLNNINENDPENAFLVKLKKKIELQGLYSEQDLFRLSELESMAGFSSLVPATNWRTNLSQTLPSSTFLAKLACPTYSLISNIEKWQEPSRHRLIRMRNIKPHLFLTPIPLDEDSILKNEFYQGLLKDNIQLRPTTLSISIDMNGNSIEPHESLPNKLENFLIRIQQAREDNASSVNSITKKKSKKKGSVNVSSIVQEVALPGIFSLSDDQEFDWTFSWLIPQPKRSLRPKRVSRPHAALTVKSCHIHVQVISARNVPLKKRVAGKAIVTKQPHVRDSHDGAASDSDTSQSAESVSSVDSFDDRESKNSTRSRSKARAKSKSSRAAKPVEKEKSSASFVEVSFQGSVATTMSAEGKCPTWKEDMALEFCPPNQDFSPGNLTLVRDTVRVSLFEETICDDKDMGGFLEGEDTIRAEKLFIGSVEIPFTTIYMEGTIDGTFMLDCPSLRCGYVCESSIAAETEARNREDEYTTEIRERSIESASHCSIRLMLTINPLLQFSEEDAGDVDDCDHHLPKEFAPFLVKWQQKVRAFNSATASRNYDVFGTSTAGEKVLMTRFLRLQTPPEMCRNLQSCMHFVSLIPFIEDWQLFTKSSTRTFVGEMDMWCTTQEFLNLASGDWEEHAVLLCNYLSYMLNDLRKSSRSMGANAIKHVYLAMGNAVPQGDCVFIVAVSENAARSEIVTDVDDAERDRKLKNMRRKRNERTTTTTCFESILECWDGSMEAMANLTLYGSIYGKLSRKNGKDFSTYLIDAVTGNCFTASDSYCPFKDISMLVTSDNMYANIQQTSEIGKMEFDVTDIESWIPLFSEEGKPNKNSFPRPESGMGTVQIECPEYTEPDFVNALEVEKVIASSLKSSFRRWRTGNQITTYHKETTSALYDMLALLESKKMGDGQIDVKEEMDKRLAVVNKTRTVVGFPLNVSYTDFATIESMVKSTDFYDNSHPDVQFAIAVRVFAFPCRVLSVWVFLAQITPKN